MDLLLEWIGTLALLGMLLIFVPVIFMGIVTLQFRLIKQIRNPRPDTLDRHNPDAHGNNRTAP